MVRSLKEIKRSCKMVCVPICDVIGGTGAFNVVLFPYTFFIAIGSRISLHIKCYTSSV